MIQIQKQPRRGMVGRLLGLLPLLLIVASCSAMPNAVAKPPKTDDTLSGQFAGSGGSATLAVVKALTDRFQQLHPNVTWTLEDVGSDASIALTANGGADMGWISRDLKAPEKSQVGDVPVGASGTALAINASNPVRNLTKDQVRQIFSGEITDWSAVGGNPGKIRVLIREKEAATRAAFEGYFYDGEAKYASDATEVYELDETLSAIHSFRDAVGMVTLDSRTLGDDQIKLLSIDGVKANLDNLIQGSYKVRRPLYVIYNVDATKVKPGVKALLDFIRSPEGQDIITKVTAGG